MMQLPDPLLNITEHHMSFPNTSNLVNSTLPRTQSLPANFKPASTEKPLTGETTPAGASQASTAVTGMLDIKRGETVVPQSFGYSTSGTASVTASAGPTARPAPSYVRVDLGNPTQVANIAALALSLDKRNAPLEQQDSGRYLTLPLNFSPATLPLFASLPSVVAVGDDGETAGFMLASEPNPNSPSLVLQGLHALVQDSDLRDMRLGVYGPIGVAATHQGQGVAKTLFDSLKEQFAHTDKQALVGFVDARNVPSLSLHEKKLDFTEFGRFMAVGQEYVAIQYLLPKHAGNASAAAR